MSAPVCPRCERLHDFDPAWGAELHDMWCDADRRLSKLEAGLKDVGMLLERAETASQELDEALRDDSRNSATDEGHS